MYFTQDTDFLIFTYESVKPLMKQRLTQQLTLSAGTNLLPWERERQDSSSVIMI